MMGWCPYDGEECHHDGYREDCIHNGEDIRIKDDCVSRKAVIEEVCLLCIQPNCFKDKYTCVTLEALKRMPAAEPEHKWIPCNERLPELHQKVLVTYVTEDGLKVAVTMLDRYGFLIGEVTAWQYLPEPYKKEGESHGRT